MKRIILKIHKNSDFYLVFTFVYHICNVCREQKCAMVPTIVFENKQGFLS